MSADEHLRKSVQKQLKRLEEELKDIEENREEFDEEEYEEMRRDILQQKEEAEATLSKMEGKESMLGVKQSAEILGGNPDLFVKSEPQVLRERMGEVDKKYRTGTLQLQHYTKQKLSLLADLKSLTSLTEREEAFIKDNSQEMDMTQALSTDIVSKISSGMS